MTKFEKFISKYGETIPVIITKEWADENNTTLCSLAVSARLYGRQAYTQKDKTELIIGGVR